MSLQSSGETSGGQRLWCIYICRPVVVFLLTPKYNLRYVRLLRSCINVIINLQDDKFSVNGRDILHVRGDFTYTPQDLNDGMQAPVIKQSSRPLSTPEEKI